MAAAYDDGDDHYSVLGLPSGEEGAKLTLDEIRKAFRTQSLARHPDKRPGDPAATVDFQRLLASYDALCDPPTRRLLDARIRGRASGEPYYNKRRRGDEEDPIESYRQRAARRRHSEQAEAGHAAYYKRRPCDEDDPKEEAYRRFPLWRMRKRAEALRAHAEALLRKQQTTYSEHQSGGEEDSIQSLARRCRENARRCRDNLEIVRVLVDAFYLTRASSFKEYKEFKEYGRTPV